MCSDNGGVDHHVFIVTTRSEMAKYPFDHTSFTPEAQSPVHVFPVPETAQKKVFYLLPRVVTSAIAPHLLFSSKAGKTVSTE